MAKFSKKNLSFFSFLLIPILFLWHPNWIGILGVQPYWPLFWLLPWSMIHGSRNGLVVGLLIGLVLDAISPDRSFTQIPGLILCGMWFGQIRTCSNFLVGHLRYGLICSIGSFICSFLYFFQIFINNFSENNFLFFLPGLTNIFAQVFLTGFFAPLICTQLLGLFRTSIVKKSI